jgi:hypothetical protein
MDRSFQVMGALSNSQPEPEWRLLTGVAVSF